MLMKSLIVAVALSAGPAKKAPAKKTDAALKAQLKDVATTPAAASADGGIDVTKMPFTPDSIKQVVASAQPAIQTCYEEHLSDKGDKAVEGTLKTSFIITPEGYVKSARVDAKGSSLKDAGLHTCVVSVLSALSFPKPPDGKPQPVEFPFNLKAIH